MILGLPPGVFLAVAQSASFVLPIASICSLMRILSMLGRLKNNLIRLSIALKAWLKANFFSISVPATAAGAGIPQWAVIGMPGHTGQASPAALSPTVITKS